MAGQLPLRLIPLGTNGFIPTQGRQTMSFLVVANDKAILLDAGSGVARLLDQPGADLLRACASLDIVLSHYHLDHVVGLSYLPAIWQGRPLHIHGPQEPLVHAQLGEALNGLIRPPYFPLTLAEYPAPITMTPITDESFAIGDITVRVRAQKHSGGSIGIRLGDAIAYTTDTVVDQGTVAFVRGVKILLHELWLDDTETPAEEATKGGHSFASGVVDLAVQAGVGRLMIVHHNPRRSTAQIMNTAAAAQAKASIPVLIPEEGKVYEI